MKLKKTEVAYLKLVSAQTEYQVYENMHSLEILNLTFHNQQKPLTLGSFMPLLSGNLPLFLNDEWEIFMHGM